MLIFLFILSFVDIEEDYLHNLLRAPTFVFFYGLLWKRRNLFTLVELFFYT